MQVLVGILSTYSLLILLSQVRTNQETVNPEMVIAYGREFPASAR